MATENRRHPVLEHTGVVLPLSSVTWGINSLGGAYPGSAPQHLLNGLHVGLPA